MSTKPRRDPGLKVTVLPDGHVAVYSPSTNCACTLTPIAALVWEFCDGNNTADGIVEQITAIDGVPDSGSLKAEVEKLLKEFSDSGLLLDVD